MLLVRGRHVARTLEQHTRRIALAQLSTKPKFEIFKTVDHLRAKGRRRARILEILALRHLSKILNRVVELSGRLSLLLELLPQRFGIGQSLRRFARELLAIFGRQLSAAARIRAIRNPAAVRHSAATQTLLPALTAGTAAAVLLLAALGLLALLALLPALSLLSLLPLLATLALLSLLTTLPLLTLGLLA